MPPKTNCEAYLLDTNVLIALAWPNHVHHGAALRWFQLKAASCFRTCPITQTGFVRISSNPSFHADVVTPVEALAVLAQILAQPGHGFWPDDLDLGEPCGRNPLIATHRQVTDAYLVGLADAHDGVLATLDRGIRALTRRAPERVELILQ